MSIEEVLRIANNLKDTDPFFEKLFNQLISLNEQEFLFAADIFLNDNM